MPDSCRGGHLPGAVCGGRHGAPAGVGDRSFLALLGLSSVCVPPPPRVGVFPCGAGAESGVVWAVSIQEGRSGKGQEEAGRQGGLSHAGTAVCFLLPSPDCGFSTPQTPECCFAFSPHVLLYSVHSPRNASAWRPSSTSARSTAGRMGALRLGTCPALERPLQHWRWPAGGPPKAWQGHTGVPVGATRSLEGPHHACGRVWNVQMRRISRKRTAARRAPSRRWGADGAGLGARGTCQEALEVGRIQGGLKSVKSELKIRLG